MFITNRKPLHMRYAACIKCQKHLFVDPKETKMKIMDKTVFHNITCPGCHTELDPVEAFILEVK